MTVTQADTDIDDLATALYGLSAIRRDLQRCAGIEHAVGALTALAAVRRLGPVRISDIAAELQVNLSVASRQLQTLQSDGYVDRVADPHDGRSSLVALSPEGEARLAATHQRFTDALARAVSDWEPTQVTDLAAGVVRLRSSLCDQTAVRTDSPAARAADTTVHAAPASGPGDQEQSR